MVQVSPVMKWLGLSLCLLPTAQGSWRVRSADLATGACAHASPGAVTAGAFMADSLACTAPTAERLPAHAAAPELPILAPPHLSHSSTRA